MMIHFSLDNKLDDDQVNMLYGRHTDLDTEYGKKLDGEFSVEIADAKEAINLFLRYYDRLHPQDKPKYKENPTPTSAPTPTPTQTTIAVSTRKRIIMWH